MGGERQRRPREAPQGGVFDQSPPAGTVDAVHTPLQSAYAGSAGVLALAVPAAGIALAAVLLLCTPLVLALARRRVAAQPLDTHPQAERDVLAAVLAEPGHYVYVHQLLPEHFVDETLGAAWAGVREYNRGVPIPDVPGDEDAAYAMLASVGVLVPSGLDAHLHAGGHHGLPAPARIAREELVARASLVYNSGVDRNEYAGSARIERTGEPARPLRRVPSRTTPLRAAITALMLATGGLVAGATATRGTTTAAQAGIAAALVLLTVGSVIWTLVDLETMYVDTPTFWALGGAAWAAALAGAALDGTLRAALTGLLVVLAVVGGIEAVNQVYRRIRGRHGMGMGDYLLVLATIGVPVAVTGDMLLGQVILIVSLLAGIVGWTFTRLTRPGFTRDTPYAFGPYLASGWLLGMLVNGVLP